MSVNYFSRLNYKIKTLSLLFLALALNYPFAYAGNSTSSGILPTLGFNKIERIYQDGDQEIHCLIYPQQVRFYVDNQLIETHYGSLSSSTDETLGLLKLNKQKQLSKTCENSLIKDYINGNKKSILGCYIENDYIYDPINTKLITTLVKEINELCTLKN